LKEQKIHADHEDRALGKDESSKRVGYNFWILSYNGCGKGHHQEEQRDSQDDSKGKELWD
jgi:hypothetical protein